MGVPIVSASLKKIFGTRNERMVKKYMALVEQVSALEPSIRPLSDPEIGAMTTTFHERINNGESIDTLTPEIFAVAREAMDRSVGIRNIFNPEEAFDPGVLSPHLQEMYASVQAEIDAAEPRQPEDALQGCMEEVPPWLWVDIPVELYEAVRELHPVSTPPFRSRPFDCQIIGAIVLSEGRIAEMKTGEGKTIVAPLAAYLAALQDEQVHVVTVNDYLVQRDRDWTFPFFRAVGLTVGAIHPMHMQPPQEKQRAYGCNVVYGTTSEFGFDYLRDNMKLSVEDQVQTKRHFAIVDEVDSTLIDEARTPLIISGPAHQQDPRYDLADRLACHLVKKQDAWKAAEDAVLSAQQHIALIEGEIRNTRDKEKIPALKGQLEEARAALPAVEAARDTHVQYFEVERDKKKATLTHEGISEAQRESGLGSFYQGENVDLPHLLEQAIRAHTVYQRDRDYVVAPDPDDGTPIVVIVDQNTGRKMIGRQWSDGLHQAVESKEKVPIKQETQTMATITIQNFYKLYGRLSGMTGTADTEATEFHEIYKLDVIVIPTNVLVIRDDREDVVFLQESDKWDAIVDEIKNMHDLGCPVLVGTTSVEKSDYLSELLTRTHRIEHEVLNAKHHEREADIIAGAGELGAVTVATNMAGRGTDIKLRDFSLADLLDHWKRRGLAPKDARADMDEDEILSAVYRHRARKQLELSPEDLAAMDDDDVQLALFRSLAEEFCMISESRARSLTRQDALKMLDGSGSCKRHRVALYGRTEELGGLHVIGTERHESRRIDNQLRGRSGRQGDRGASRFYLSLEDDLMKMFAGERTQKILSRVGMKEGDAVEHPMLSRAVGKAQRKVEERNFLIRKNILEYDEVMDHQRHEFYGIRQVVLEGQGVKDIIFTHIEEAVIDALYHYLDRNYAPGCIAAWLAEQMEIAIDTDRIRGKDREDLSIMIGVDAKEEAANIINITIGEYLPEGADEESRDVPSFVNWANRTYGAVFSVEELQTLSTKEIARRVERAAFSQVDAVDLSPLEEYLDPLYGEKQLCAWIEKKFDRSCEPDMFVDLDDPIDAKDVVLDLARESYQKREITYPVDFALDMTLANMQQDPGSALDHLCTWARTRYELNWKPDALPSPQPAELRELLVSEAEKWDQIRIAGRARRCIEAGDSLEELDTWSQEHLGVSLTEEEEEQAADDPQDMMVDKLTALLRAELTQFERWVLLQILDQSWKDHLYSVDQLREAIGLRSFSQRDPRIEFKRECAALFDEMHMRIRDRVTDLVFRARLTPQPPPRPAGSGNDRAQRTTLDPVAAAAASASAGTESQRRDLQAAALAGAPSPARRPHRMPHKAAATVGRNEPCPCGSGKKYKKCCGRAG